MREQHRREVFAEEFHPILLVGFPPHAHPDQMNVVWHQAIGRAKEPFARRSVEHDFAEVSVECVVQSSSAAHGDGHGPMDDGVGLVIFSRQALQIETPICA
jgi:hypothetical protein